MQRKIIREARQKAKLTALELAEQTGIDEMRLYSLERGRGRIRKDEIEALSRVLGVDASSLIGGAQ